MATPSSAILGDLLQMASQLCGTPIAIVQFAGIDVAAMTMAHGIDAFAAGVQLDGWTEALADLTPHASEIPPATACWRAIPW